MLSWRALARLFSLANRNDVGTEVMHDMARFDIHHAMATLQAKAPGWTATALTEVARTMGRDPFKILHWLSPQPPHQG